MNTTRQSDLNPVPGGAKVPNEWEEAVAGQDPVCGWLEVVDGSASYVRVRATRTGCFTWVFSRGGKVISMQSITAIGGQEYDAYGNNATVGINCDC
jgi:hypothetical protein